MFQRDIWKGVSGISLPKRCENIGNITTSDAISHSHLYFLEICGILEVFFSLQPRLFSSKLSIWGLSCFKKRVYIKKTCLQPLCSWATLLCITPPKKYYHLAFFLTYQAFKNREGIVYQTNLAEWFKIWHLWLETNKNMDDF